jgi:DNA-binding transcriptional LysR family regulator
MILYYEYFEDIKMDLEYLNTFIEVAKQENLSKAAKRLSLSQPTVSVQIKKLEKELGCRLIERDTRHFMLTLNGKRFFRFAEYVYQEHRNLLFDIAQNEKGIIGSISIAATPNIGEYVVPDLISRFKEGNPAMDTYVEIMDLESVVKTVTQNPDIVGFCGVAPNASELNCIKLGEDQLVLIVYPGHPFLLKKQVTIADLLGETLIFRAATFGKQSFYAGILKRAGIDLDVYQPKTVMGTTTGVLSAVESKAGIGFVSKLAIKHSEAMGVIQVVIIKHVKLKTNYYFVHNKNIHPDALLSNFISFINQNSSK